MQCVCVCVYVCEKLQCVFLRAYLHYLIQHKYTVSILVIFVLVNSLTLSARLLYQHLCEPRRVNVCSVSNRAFSSYRQTQQQYAQTRLCLGGCYTLQCCSGGYIALRRLKIS